MPDLLAHVFVAYGVCRVLALRRQWLTDRHVTLAMVGSVLPDLVKITLVVPGETVAHVVQMPFSWGSLHTGGGVLLSVLFGTALLSPEERRRGGVALAVGAGSHLFADSLLLTPSGRTVQLFWPLSQYRVPSPGLYLSTQPEPTIVAGLLALLAWLASEVT